MLFNSFAFLVFFPLVTLIYYWLPHKFRWIHLLAVSCLFYMFFIPVYILILLVTIVIDFYAGIKIEESTGHARKTYLVLSIVSTCLVLGVFKYYNFFIGNFNTIATWLDWNYSVQALSLILPIGLSFHTFQSLSYVIEVYRGKQRAERHFGIYSLYVMYYPQLVAGPIERPQNLLHQFRSPKNFYFQNFYAGLRLMLFGFFMKLVVADRLSVYVDAVYGNHQKHTGTTLLVATVFFAVQIYCDFAGYSSIAIGASRMMGIRLMTNFRRPYLSASVSEFWRRWHISLSTWFKDYVYISLGGNRVKTRLRGWANLMITFLISGFWHGANWTFVIWGGLNGLYLIIENAFSGMFPGWKPSRWVGALYVFVLISFSWIFFRADSLNTAFDIVGRIFSSTGSLFVPANPEQLLYAVLAILLIMLMDIGYEKVYRRRSWKFNRTAVTNIWMLVLFFSIVLLGVFDGGQFIYFQF